MQPGVGALLWPCRALRKTEGTHSYLYSLQPLHSLEAPKKPLFHSRDKKRSQETCFFSTESLLR